MFYFTGILPCYFLWNAKLNQILRQRLVPVIDSSRNGIALVRQGNQAVLSHRDIFVLSQLFHGDAYRRLGYIQPDGDIR